jgi:hypothetical protein
MPPILIMMHANDSNSFHAVTAVGVRLLEDRPRGNPDNGIDDISENLEAIYVQDDRTGPYVRANIIRRPDGSLGLDLLRRREPELADHWIVTHILVPSHSKIRLSFSSLRKLAIDLVGWLHQAAALLIENYDRKRHPVTFETSVTRGHAYLARLYFEDGAATKSAIGELTQEIIFPRYVGVVRLTSNAFRTIDVLFDTTSTLKNLHCVAVVVAEPNRRTILAAGLIAQVYDAALVF